MYVEGGRGTYGAALGILMLDTKFARIPGDVGNATTYHYPVMYKTVENASSDLAISGDPSLLQPFIDGARELEAAGCRAITTSCGFLALFQKELAAAVHIPVFTSSLLQVPMASRMIRPDQKVGIITANAASLGRKQFEGVGIKDEPVVVIGLEDTFFLDMCRSESGSYDTQDLKKEMEDHAKRLISEHPEIGAIVFECTNMPPFAKAVQDVTHLPVFDYTTLADYVFSAVVRREFRGWM